MNLTEAKDQVAHSRGWKDWRTLYHSFRKAESTDAMEMLVNEVSTLYASEKVKEALKVAAEKAKTTWITDHPVELNHIGIDKDSILSLETELIDKIKNEK